MRFRSALAGLLVFGALAPSSLRAQQTDTTAAVAAAQAAALAWLSLIDNGSIAASWDSSSAAFRAAVSRTDWTAAVHSARDPFEPFGARQLALSRYTTQLPGAPAGQYVLLQFETGVSQGRRVVETVVPMVDPDGQWRVSGYYVRPTP
jgi:hypothetical protein